MSERHDGVDWRGWAAEIARRIDRVVIVGAIGLAVFSVALMHIEHANFAAGLLAQRSLYWLTTVLVTVLALATSMVAVARGARPGIAYVLAAVVIVTAAAAADLAFAPYAWNVGTASRHFPATIVAHLTILSMLLAPAAVFYVCASNAAHQARLLRSLDLEGAAETERLVQQRLQTELATIDHELVLDGMRLALPLLASDAGRAEELLGAVTAYLRVAHQRGAGDARAVVVALEQLRQLCLDRSGQPALG